MATAHVKEEKGRTAEDNVEGTRNQDPAQSWGDRKSGERKVERSTSSDGRCHAPHNDPY
jgi:hypothetical protein